jgi:hypothetical protein
MVADLNVTPPEISFFAGVANGDHRGITWRIEAFSKYTFNFSMLI